MCGIAGYFGDRKLESSRIEQCLQLMHQRGPDFTAYREWMNDTGKNIYLLHSRLNIIDLDNRANQPFHYGSKWIAYNGELYNYLELRDELIQRGCAFNTSSDTEVLLGAIDQYGQSVLDRCEGMWAFAIYDEKDGSLLLGRDRFGEKPLYVYQDDSGFYFGSEVKFIVALLGKKLKINYDHLCRYLVNGYKALYKSSHTFFVDLKELPSGSTLSVDSEGRQQERRYWKPCFLPNDEMTYDEAVVGVRDKLIDSVKLRLRADVPLAFCMSGGIDSNSLISIAKNVFNYNVHGFTIMNSDARYEEQDMVEYAVKELQIRHTPIAVETKDFLSRLRKLVKQHDAPVYTVAYYAHWLLMDSIANHGYRVSVSGTGSDELFTGYYDHHLAYLYEVHEEPALYAASSRAWQEHIRPLVRNPYLQNPTAFIENPDLRDHIYLNADIFAGYLRNSWSEPFTENQYTQSLLRNRMLNEMFHESVPVILHEDDLNAMYFSIENRSPYLDRHLFEFCNTIPSRHLIQNGRAKSILRDAMKEIMPERIRTNRRKVGFNAPIFSFLDVRDRVVKNYLLNESPIFDYVQRDKIENLIEKTNLPNSESKFLFYFLCSKIFLEEFDS